MKTGRELDKRVAIEAKLKNYHNEADLLAKGHVEFILEIVQPLMEAEFVHGYKHGLEAALKVLNKNLNGVSK